MREWTKREDDKQHKLEIYAVFLGSFRWVAWFLFCRAQCAAIYCTLTEKVCVFNGMQFPPFFLSNHLLYAAHIKTNGTKSSEMILRILEHWTLVRPAKKNQN